VQGPISRAGECKGERPGGVIGTALPPGAGPTASPGAVTYPPNPALLDKSCTFSGLWLGALLRGRPPATYPLHTSSGPERHVATVPLDSVQQNAARLSPLCRSPLVPSRTAGGVPITSTWLCTDLLLSRAARSGSIVGNPPQALASSCEALL
jgi:hypothetical protein